MNCYRYPLEKNKDMQGGGGADQATGTRVYIHDMSNDGPNWGQNTVGFNLQGRRKRLASTAQAVRKRARFTRKLCFGPIERCVFMKKSVYKTSAQVPL